MFGLIVGTLCLVALVATLRRRHFYRYAYAFPYRHGPGYWPGRHDGYGPRMAYGGFARPGRATLLRALFARLDTTHGQEKALGKIADGVRERLGNAPDELTSARKELAAAVGGDVIDGSALDTAVARYKALLDRLGQELTQTLLSMHEVLDGKQRKLLAELIADGPRGFRRGWL